MDVGDGSIKMPTYISVKIDPNLKHQVLQLLKNYKDFCAWDYDEIPGLSRELVELKFPIHSGKKHMKQLPRRFASAILSKIKEQIERLLKRFIRSSRYVE